MGDTDAELARRILSWLDRTLPPEPSSADLLFSRREAFSAARFRSGSASTVASFEAPLALLVRRGWIRPLPEPDGHRRKRGRPASPVYELRADWRERRGEWR